MAHQPEPASRRYSAFISYSHADRRVAERLQTRLERYRLPRRIARRIGVDRLKPVFRDRTELAAAADLSGAVRAAILDADYLIVICTAHAAASDWVGREIAFFRASHGDGRILSALFGAGGDACFHASLTTQGDRRPLAADFRVEGDSERLALLKLVAALVGVGLDDLVQRDAQRQVRRIAIIAGAALVAIIVVAAGTLIAMQAQATAERERARSARAADFQLTELRRKVKAGGTLDMAAAVNRGVALYYDRQDGSNAPVEDQLKRVELLQAEAEDNEKRGDFAAAWRDARAAWLITTPLVAAHPDDTAVIFGHAQSAYWVGFVAWRAGDVERARAAFTRYAELAAMLVRRDGAKLAWRMEYGYANSNLGMLALRETQNLTLARGYFQTALKAFAAVSARSRDTDAVYEMADGEAWLGDVDLIAGNYAGALRHREAQRGLLASLLAQDPRNVLYRVDMLTNQIGLARVATGQGRADAALAQLETAYAAATELARADPANASIARQKRAVELFMARSLLASQPAKLSAARRSLGDCAADWRAAGGEELGTFCSLLSAKLELASGNQAGAAAILAAPRVAAALAKPTLSPRWRLNFVDEYRKLGANPGARVLTKKGDK